jgi:hypothetical protein
MNLPGVDTYVCDASATKDADARGSQICPPARWTQKVAYWHLLGPLRNVRLESEKQAKADS